MRRPGQPNPHIDPAASRPLTPAEQAVLTGFPADYPFQGGKRDGYKMVGNAVAPPIATAIGKAVRSIL